MTKLKATKITLSLFILLQLNPTMASEAAPLLLASSVPLETAITETIELLDIDIPENSLIEIVQTFEKIKHQYLEVYEKQFKNIKEYPEMSLCDLGDAIIEIINTAGTRLPEDIKYNLIKLIDVKKRAKNIKEIKAPHSLISQILIQIIDLKLTGIDNEFETLTKYLAPEDIIKIKKSLLTYQKQIKKLQQNGTFKSPDDVKTDLKKINDKLENIWLSHPLYSKIKRQFKIEDEKPLSIIEFAAKKAREAKEQLDAMELFNYRISKNNYSK